MTVSALNPLIKAMPIRAGGWVQNRVGEVARIRAAYRDTVDSHVLMDLIYYHMTDGDKIGRLSPAMGGPRGYEPCVTYDDWWFRIHPPTFPLKLRQQEDGSFSYLQPSLPDSEYLPPPPYKLGAVHDLKNCEDMVSLRIASMRAADELRERIKRSNLTGAAKEQIEKRIQQLESESSET